MTTKPQPSYSQIKHFTRRLLIICSSSSRHPTSDSFKLAIRICQHTTTTAYSLGISGLHAHFPSLCKSPALTHTANLLTFKGILSYLLKALNVVR
jgi:hypothetical protein